MDKTTVNELPVFRSEVFRTPSQLEAKVGLWVDRIGRRSGQAPAPAESLRLRILGQYAAVFVRSGGGYLMSPAPERFPVGGGDAMVLFPEIPAAQALRQESETVWVVWNGTEARCLEDCGFMDSGRPVVADRLNSVERAYSALAPIMDDEGQGAVLERKTIVLTMIRELHQSAERGRRATDDVMRAASSYLAAACAESLDMDAVAKRFNLSATHFRRLFREYTGRSPREYVTGLRIARAKEMLSRGMPIKHVARQTGYQDVFYFMRVFKKVAGVTPGRFAAIGH